jgi:AcrR family transcriptional regulator
MKNRPAMKQISTRKQLMAAAKSLFAHKGLSGTSIRDIAQAARINSSMISYYFDGKEGLYKACIEEIAQAVLTMTERVLQPVEDLAEFRLRLQMFLDGMFALFLEDRDTGLILIREYDRTHSPAEEIFRASLLKVMKEIVGFFRSAQKAGLISEDKDPFTLASLLFGCVTSMMRMDHLSEKTYKKSLLNPAEKRKVENHIVDLFTIRPKIK